MHEYCGRALLRDDLAPLESRMEGMRVSSQPAAPAMALPRRGRKVLAFIRMGRTNYWENWLCILLCWTLLDGTLAFQSRTFLLLSLSLVAAIASVAAGCTLDDVQGWRNGSDLINYQGSDATGLRPVQLKPLLLGWVTEREAVLYAGGAGLTAFVVGVTAWFAAGRRPIWVLAAGVALLLVAAQYSFGLKFSYIGGQELTLGVLFFAAVFLTYAVITGEAHALAVVQGVLWSSWMIVTSLFSNIFDAGGDGQAGRRTVAVRGGELWSRRCIVGVVTSTWVLVAFALAVCWLPAWYVAPCLAIAGLQLVQLRAGVWRRNYLKARALGFMVVRVGVILLAGTNIIVRWL